MATLHHSSSHCSVTATGKGEPLLLPLPLELRQRIYAIIFGPQRLVNLSYVHLELDPWFRSMVYRPKSEKLHESNWFGNDKEIDSESEEKLSESNSESKEKLSESNSGSEEKLSESSMEDTYRFKEAVRYEWRTGILEVSKATSDEALDVLYGQNAFVVHIHGEGYRKLLKLGAANLRRVRYLRIVARPMGDPPLVFDPQLWLPLLDRLLQFCIVAQQPLVARSYYNAPTLEQDMYEWTSWLDPILQYFSTNLARTTAVGLDDDGHAETTAMVDQYFVPGYQKVKTITGDFIFERGQYSRESGYWDSDGRDGCSFEDGGMGDDWSD